MRRSLLTQKSYADAQTAHRVNDLLIGWRLLAQADVARTALATAPAHDEAIGSLDDTIMNLPEAAF